MAAEQEAAAPQQFITPSTASGGAALATEDAPGKNRIWRAYQCGAA